jgi:hypothetical protein
LRWAGSEVARSCWMAPRAQPALHLLEAAACRYGQISQGPTCGEVARVEPSLFCSDRRQGGHMFGDMVDGFVVAQVDLRHDVTAIAEVEETILMGGA